MNEIRKHPTFTKHYRQRIDPTPKLRKQFKERFTQFLTNPQHPLLHDHPLKGSRQGDRAFSVTGDVRVIYRFINEKSILLLDIGTHNQVYGK